jgi:hypothetical protein
MIADLSRRHQHGRVKRALFGLFEKALGRLMRAVSLTKRPAHVLLRRDQARVGSMTIAERLVESGAIIALQLASCAGLIRLGTAFLLGYWSPQGRHDAPCAYISSKTASQSSSQSCREPTAGRPFMHTSLTDGPFAASSPRWAAIHHEGHQIEFESSNTETKHRNSRQRNDRRYCPVLFQGSRSAVDGPDWRGLVFQRNGNRSRHEANGAKCPAEDVLGDRSVSESVA